MHAFHPCLADDESGAGPVDEHAVDHPFHATASYFDRLRAGEYEVRPFGFQGEYRRRDPGIVIHRHPAPMPCRMRP